MTQARRRIVFWIVILFLVAVGIVLQASANGAQRPNSGQSAPPGLQERKSDEAILQSFICVLSVVGFQLASAEKSCSAAIDLRPDDPVGYKYRGLTYLLQHRFERAELDFRSAVKFDPKTQRYVKDDAANAYVKQPMRKPWKLPSTGWFGF